MNSFHIVAAAPAREPHVVARRQKGRSRDDGQLPTAVWDAARSSQTARPSLCAHARRAWRAARGHRGAVEAARPRGRAELARVRGEERADWRGGGARLAARDPRGMTCKARRSMTRGLAVRAAGRGCRRGAWPPAAHREPGSDARCRPRFFFLRPPVWCARRAAALGPGVLRASWAWTGARGVRRGGEGGRGARGRGRGAARAAPPRAPQAGHRTPVPVLTTTLCVLGGARGDAGARWRTSCWEELVV